MALCHVTTTWLLLSLAALCAHAYFPGLSPDDNFSRLCGQAQTYTAGGSPVAEGGRAPYTVKPSMDEYIPGHNIRVSVVGTEPFMGVILQARKLSTKRMLGTFSFPDGSPHAAAALKNCDVTGDTVFLWLPAAANNVTLLWTPPPDDVGTLQFIGTVFAADGDTFWPNITAARFSRGFADIDITTCGTEKGCFRYSRDDPDCDMHTCEYLVTTAVHGNNVHFELMGRAGWVAIGFSSDDKMGGDDVLICLQVSQSAVEVGTYWTDTPYVQPVRQDNDPLYDKQVMRTDDGRILCRFKRPLKVMNDQFSVDLNNDWYQLYAWGDVSDTGGSLMKHQTRPPVSEKLTVYRKLDVTGAAPPRLQAAHGTMTALVAMALTSIVFGHTLCVT